MKPFLPAVLSLILWMPAAGSRPHVVLFIADDLTWHDCGVYGSADARTPNIDALAKESLKFDAAFAASPTCTPSRSAMYTGQYPFRNGAHANHSLVRDGTRSLPHYMKDLGYRVVLAGKTHIGPRECFPFEYLADSNVLPPGKQDVLWTDLNTAAIDRLLAEHDPATQLCLVVAAHSPHVYWPENDGYDAAKLKPPPYLLDTPVTRLNLCRYLTDVSWLDKQVGEVRQSLSRHGYGENTLLIFTSDQGAQWPFAKWTLYDAGIRVPLLVRWPGVVKPGSTPAMVSLIDLLPTMIAAAGGTPPGDIDGQSFLAVLHGEAHWHREEIFASHTGDGKMNRSPARCVRTAGFKFILNLLPNDEFRTHITSGGANGNDYWKSWTKMAASGDRAAGLLVDRYLHRPAEELYDVVNDPYEQSNLAADPARAGILAELRQKLKDWRMKQGEDVTKIPMPEDARHGDIPYAK